MHPVHGVVEISSSDPRAAGRNGGPGASQRPLVESGQRRFPCGSARALLEIRFRNGLYRTQPVTAASVSGKHEDGSRWSYEVF